MAYSDLNDVQVPGQGKKILAAWGRGVRSNQQDHEGRISSLEPQLWTDPLPFIPATDIVATNRVNIIGMEPAATRLFGRDGTAPGLAQSDDWGETWTLGKAMPAGIRYNNLTKMVRYGAHFYLTADDVAGDWFVFRCPVVDAATAYAWETSPVFTYRADTSNLVRVAFNAGSQYLFLAEYGDPATAPRIYRSADGSTWEQVHELTDGARHFHAVIEDPYNAGHIYASPGDFTTDQSLIKSEDHGDTWAAAVLASGNAWQAVQVSFSEEWIWLASDRQGTSVAIVDRETLTPRSASVNWHSNIAVPAGAEGDRFFSQAYFGAVDPETGIYYFVSNDTSSPIGNRVGFFFLTKVGDPIYLLDIPTWNGTEVFIGGGRVWIGSRSFEVLQ